MKQVNPTQGCDRAWDALRPAPRPGHFVADRWQVLQLVKDTAKLTGIGEREIAVLGAHLSVLTKGPVSAGQLLVSYAQVTGLLERANCMEERRFRRGEARLEELGFVTRKLSANARRFPVRDAEGRVVDAYGVDLRPLFLRITELETARQQQLEAEQRHRALATRISARISAIKRQAQALLGHIPESLDAESRAIRNLLRRTGVSTHEMIAAEQHLHATEAALLGHPQVATAAVSAVTPPAQTSAAPDKTPADAGQIDRHIESPPKEYTPAHQPQRTEPEIPIPILWASCPEVSTMFPDTPQTPEQLAARLFEFSNFIGLGQQVVMDALKVLGLARLLIVLDYLAGKIHSIARPQGYLKSMLQKASVGERIAGGRVSLRCPVMV